MEDLTTAAQLAGLGCYVAQGFALARPMPVEAFIVWLDGDRLQVLSPPDGSFTTA